MDDHPTLISSLEMLLNEVPDIQVIGTALSGIKLLETLKKMKQEDVTQVVDVILMDIIMEPIDGWETTKQLKTIYPDIKVIMFSSHDNHQDVLKSLADGADGFLSKNLFSVETLQNAIQQVQQGKRFLVYPDVGKEKTEDLVPETVSFSKRELQIIRLICQNFDQETIASKLQLSPLAITTYLKNIKSQLGVETNEGLIQEALKYPFDG